MEERDRLLLRWNVILLRYGNESPKVLDAAVMTDKQAATVLQLSIHQVKLLERRYFFAGYQGRDDDVKMDLTK